MKLIRTDRFLEDYCKMPLQIQKQTDQKLIYLVENIRHPSLRIKRLQKHRDIYEGSINMNYRFLFQVITDAYLLLRIGKHDILDK